MKNSLMVLAMAMFVCKDEQLNSVAMVDVVWAMLTMISLII